jgi:hypothetical protein
MYCLTSQQLCSSTIHNALLSQLTQFFSPERNKVVSSGLDSSGSGEGPVAGPYEHGNESSGSVTGREFLN